MVTISYKKDNMCINGHTNYAEKGKDIVCCAISTLCQFVINLDKLDYKDTKEGYVINTKKMRKETFDTLVNMFEELQQQYPKYVSITTSF
jgi:uncharacterized protein YsxB (DUF464 family)